MRKFGLIGYPLGHSFSPPYFAEKFKNLGIKDAEYRAYPIKDIEEFPSIINDELVGLNVTIPYKESVIPFLDELSDASAEIEAVNTIHHVNGRLIGHNTDYYGFRASLLDLLGENIIERALILGTGGSSKAVAYALKTMGIAYTFVSRNSNYLTYLDLSRDIVEKHQLIVNTTPVGMYPNKGDVPLINFTSIGDQHYCYDLIYNPEKTLFLKRAKERGATIKNGYDMLIIQAEKSWQIWNQ